MTLALLAAVAMVIQDIISSRQTQAQAEYKAIRAGLLDTVGWLVMITTTSISVTTLQGHSVSEKVFVVVLVSIANFGGTALGTRKGNRK